MFGGGGSSDPFATVRYLRESRRTETIKQCLDPHWNARFTIPASRADTKVSITIEDWDLTSGPDFMGRVSVPLAELADKRAHRSWHKLRAV